VKIITKSGGTGFNAVKFCKIMEEFLCPEMSDLNSGPKNTMLQR